MSALAAHLDQNLTGFAADHLSERVRTTVRNAGYGEADRFAPIAGTAGDCYVLCRNGWKTTLVRLSADDDGNLSVALVECIQREL